MIDDVRFLRNGVRQTDGRTDGRTEKVTHRGGCPTQKYSTTHCSNRYLSGQHNTALEGTFASHFLTKKI